MTTGADGDAAGRCCAMLAMTACGGSKNSASGTNAEPANITHLDAVRRPRAEDVQGRGRDFEPSTRASTSRWSAGRTTTRSSPRSAVATRPTSRSRSPPTTPARSARAAPGSTSARTCSRTASTTSIFPEAPRDYTEFEGTRCALPMLADTYGLYYNKTLLAKAGYKSPPKTISAADRDGEEADAARLERQAEGRRASTRSRAGTRTSPRTSGPSWGATWMDGGQLGPQHARLGRRSSRGRRA